MVDHQVPFAIAAILCIAAGGLCGFLNGAISVLAKIPSFIVTLGMLEIARGIAYLGTILKPSLLDHRSSGLGWLQRVFMFRPRLCWRSF